MSGTLIGKVRSHLEAVAEFGTDCYGPTHTPMFMATLDPSTKRYPDDDTRPDDANQRAYRLIHAPKGCSAYWDQPTLFAAHALARLTGNAACADAMDRYMTYFMTHCVSSSGLFLWGNHHYYDAFLDRNVFFREGPPALAFDDAAPTLHEMRPYVPDWETLHRLDPARVEAHLRQCGLLHVYDPESGGFNRHSDRTEDYAFLEAGGVLVESLAFLYSKTGDAAPLETARRIAAFSRSHRHSVTGLVINCPTQRRWDSRVTTTEVGLWARMLLRAARIVERAQQAGADEASCANPAAGRAFAVAPDARPAAPDIADEWRRTAEEALGAYLTCGYDAGSGAYYGRVFLDGTPDTGERETVYMPGTHSDMWAYLFPTHDYPAATAMTALDLRERGGLFEDAARRWAEAAAKACVARPNRQIRYAELYGRNIVFLAEYARIAGASAYRSAAERLAEEAVRELYRDGMFVGHTGAPWYDAVDGVGFLLSALLYLETGDVGAIAHF